jgi:nucleotide-binding universal stress UspA family protein
MLQSHILVPLSSLPSDTMLLNQALAIGDLLETNTHAVLAQSDPADVMMWTAEGTYSGISVDLVESAWAGANEAWVRAQANFDTLQAGVPDLTLERIIGPVAPSLVKRAALAELTLFSCENARGKGLLSNVLDALVIDAHIPVLIARTPADDIAARFRAGAMIAWNGSVEAARAVKAALPLLAISHKVIIVQAGGHEDNIRNAFHDPVSLKAFLSARGIASEIEHLDGNDAPAAIMTAAKSHDVGLLVFGAWGHSRAREFVFGGATRAFLKDQTTPSLLLCH